MAATFWLKDGKLLVDATGKPILCETCPCTTGMACICTCTSCPDGAPAEWTITLAGILNGLCGDCDNLNTTFTFTYASGCIWACPLEFCGGDPDFITFSYSGTSWELQFPASAGSTAYSVAEAAGDCTAVKTLAFVSTGLSCINWPLTVDVIPVGSGACTTVCNGCCPGGAPATLTVAVTVICDTVPVGTYNITAVWDAVNQWWYGTSDECGTLQFYMICLNPEDGCDGYIMTVYCDDELGEGFPNTCDCDPFGITANLSGDFGTCACCPGGTASFAFSVVIS